MKLLLDTHIIIWMLNGNRAMPEDLINMIQDENNDVYFSVASIWEVSIKHSSRPEKVPFTGEKLYEMCIKSGLEELKINSKHAIATTSLKVKESEYVNGDPFDRLMLAQAKVEGMKFVTHDTIMKHYDENAIMLI